MNNKQRKSAVDLLRRGNVSPSAIASFRTDESLRAAIDVTADLRSEPAPDENWFHDYFLITGDHMVLTEEGWIPAHMNTQEYTGSEPAEVLYEINAPGAKNAAIAKAESPIPDAADGKGKK